MSIQASELEIQLAEGALDPAAGGLWRDAWRRLRRNPGAIAGFVLVGLFALCAVFAPLIAPYSPRETVASLSDSLQAPSWHHLAGLDEQSRDEFSRVVFGARYSLVIGLVAVTTGLSVGLVLGAVAGYLGGFVDSLIMRLMDIMLAIPGLLLAIVFSVLGFNLIGDGVREALDPKLRGRA